MLYKNLPLLHCSKNMQTQKMIFFHWLAVLCKHTIQIMTQIVVHLNERRLSCHCISVVFAAKVFY